MPQTLFFLAMAWTDDQGDPHPNAVWWPEQKTECPRQRVGSVLWYAFRDAAAFESGLQPVGQHTVQVDPVTFVAAAAQPPQGATQAENYFHIAAGLSLAILDTDSGTKDANGAVVLRSFFQGATTVAVTIPDGP